MLCACQEKIDVSNTEGYDLFITQLKEGVKNTSHETAANHKVAKVSHMTRLPQRNPDVLLCLLCVCFVCPNMLAMEWNRQRQQKCDAIIFLWFSFLCVIALRDGIVCTPVQWSNPCLEVTGDRSWNPPAAQDVSHATFLMNVLLCAGGFPRVPKVYMETDKI